MSWTEKINNITFTIQTGDGKEFAPLWKTGETSKEFNTAIFDFIDVPKSLVERKNPKSGKYPLNFWFDGDDHIDKANEFYKSADDRRVWIVTFPNYGTIKGQPLSISRDDTNLNITGFTVDFWESIEVDYPTSNFSVKDNTLFKKDNILESSATVYSSKEVFKAEDIQKNKDSINVVSSKFNKIQTNETFAEYSNKVNKAVGSNDGLLTNSFDAILSTQDILNMPEDLETSVKNRVGAYVSAFNSLIGIFQSVPDKLFFQSMAGSCIACLCSTSTDFNSETDYQTAIEVENVVSQILEIYNVYLKTMDDVSVSIYDVENTFQPDPVVQNGLSDLVMYTIGNLYSLAFEAQQERIVYTDKETNLILLTHRYLGLDANDDNIEKFRVTNGIKLNELLKIKKGRKIKFYV